MGTFMGHALPGTLFGLYGIWFTYQVFLRYFLCQRVSGGGCGVKKWGKYQSSITFPCPCFRSLPMEAVLKIAMSVLGMIGEAATGFNTNGIFNLHSAQHISMYFFFGVSGVADMAVHYRLPGPPDLDYMAAVLAFSMEGFMFLNHLHGRSPIDTQVHMFLVYAVGACAFFTVLEMCFRKSVIPTLARAYFIILQGTWFYQIGFILYPPIGEQWEPDDHHQMMLVTLFYTWHNAIIFFLMAAAGPIIYLKVKKMSHSTVYRYLIYHHITPIPSLVENGEHTKAMLDSEDEEV